MKRPPLPRKSSLKRKPFASHKHARTKATDIQRGVKPIVHERDGGCSIFSGVPVPVFNSCCHFVPRTHGGLGIEQNIFTATDEEHQLFDKGLEKVKEELHRRAREYLMSKYPGWREEDLIYKRR